MVTEVTVFQTANGQMFATKESAERMEEFDRALEDFQECFYPGVTPRDIVEWFFTNYELQERLTTTPLPKPLNR